ncbi:MAG: response regulator, partial [Pseudomonadota bacterium]
VSNRLVVLIKPEERHLLEQVIQTGFDAYLIKPIRKASLMNILSSSESILHNHEPDTGTKRFVDALVKSTNPNSVLLAEDNDINALLARSILEKAGHTVARASNGAEAISLWQERQHEDRFDMIFMDLQMPVMDGISAIEEIRVSEKKDALRPIPIYILTADEQTETRMKGEKAGANGFLTKPLIPEKILAIANET